MRSRATTNWPAAGLDSSAGGSPSSRPNSRGHVDARLTSCSYANCDQWAVSDVSFRSGLWLSGSEKLKLFVLVGRLMLRNLQGYFGVSIYLAHN